MITLRLLGLAYEFVLGFAVFWMGQLVFPTLIFVMTLARALRLRRYGAIKGGILNVLLRDGKFTVLLNRLGISDR